VGAACVEVVGESAGHVKAKELDSPLVGCGAVISGAVLAAGAVPVAKGVISSGEESKKGRGASGMGNKVWILVEWLHF
jgi:hypothetical protein